MNIKFDCENAEIKSHSDRKRVLQVSCTNIDYESILSQILDCVDIDSLLNQLTEVQINQHLQKRL